MQCPIPAQRLASVQMLSCEQPVSWRILWAGYLATDKWREQPPLHLGYNLKLVSTYSKAKNRIALKSEWMLYSLPPFLFFFLIPS